MLQLERLEKIKEYLAKTEYAGINELAEYLQVSTATVRRSLKHLENEHMVNLTKGGACLAKKGNFYEFPYMIKQQLHAEEKRRIAGKAIQCVNKNESLFLDSSSTVYGMTRFSKSLSGATVVTNDIFIAQNLTNEEDVIVTVIGGSLRKHYYTLTGFIAETILKNLYFDRAFLGFDALSLQGGLMITNMEEVQIKQRIINCSNEVIVLCDHSKFEQLSFLTVCNFDHIDMIITGKELDQGIYRAYIEAGINLVLV
jgi:DeoR/GlpR family transcriptional regulator of sugar metabolism